jgi:hypothetical protein
MQVTRRESARITLHGNAEFEAADVTLAGDCEFDVPAGQRMRVVAGQGGKPRVSQISSSCSRLQLREFFRDFTTFFAVHGRAQSCALCLSSGSHPM